MIYQSAVAPGQPPLFEVKYQLDAKGIVKVSAKILRKKLLPVIIIMAAMGMFICIMDFGFTPPAQREEPISFGVLILFITALLLIIMLAILPAQTRKLNKKLLTMGPNGTPAIEHYCFYPYEMIQDTSVSYSYAQYRMLYAFSANESRILLYTNANSFHIIPRSALPPEQYEALRRFLHATLQQQGVKMI